MSALREENLISEKGNLFSVGDKTEPKYSGQQLQNKVTESIPELARANHGYQMQFQPAFMHPLAQQNGFTVNDLYVAPNQPKEAADVPKLAQNDLRQVVQQPMLNQTMQQPINPNTADIVFPIRLTKMLDTKEAQMQFIID